MCNDYPIVDIANWTEMLNGDLRFQLDKNTYYKIKNRGDGRYDLTLDLVKLKNGIYSMKKYILVKKLSLKMCLYLAYLNSFKLESKNKKRK